MHFWTWHYYDIGLCTQEPFDSAKEELLAELSEEEKQELGAGLRHFDLDLLLRTLLQFIKINVLHSSTEELQWP